MATDLSTELEAFRRFVTERLSDQAELSLEDCLRLWQEQRRGASHDIAPEPLYDRAQRAGLIGCFDDGPADLSTNARHLEGLGES